MKNLSVLAILTLISASSVSAKPQTLQKIVGSLGSNTRVSAQFVRIADGKVLFAHRASQTLVPASTTKLITAAAALNSLSSQYVFETPVYYTGKVENGVLKGDILIVGSGDPFLVSEKLWEFSIDLAHMGLKKIDGNILIDQGLFDAEDRDKSRVASQKYSRNAYDAPILPFSVNFNTFSVAVASGFHKTKVGKVGIWPYPLPGVMQIENRTKVVAESKKHKLLVERRTKNGRTKLQVSGSVAENGGLYKAWKSVSDANVTSGAYVLSFLRAAGIQVTGKVSKVRTPPSQVKILGVINGYPLQKSISGLNKYSNNFIADMLVKKLGQKETSRRLGKNVQGSFKNGVRSLSSFLASKVGIKSSFVIRNGSGLSLENRLSAAQIVKLLVYMEKRLDLFPEFLASLPASGWDGTLKDRFKKYKILHGKVRAKTGTLTQPVSVSSLAGYFHHKKHGLVAFAVIENGVSGKSQPAIGALRLSQEKLIVNL